MIIEIRRIEDGSLIDYAPEGFNASATQREKSAYYLMQKTTLSFDDMYCSITDPITGIAERKFQLNEGQYDE